LPSPRIKAWLKEARDEVRRTREGYEPHDLVKKMSWIKGVKVQLRSTLTR